MALNPDELHFGDDHYRDHDHSRDSGSGDDDADDTLEMDSPRSHQMSPVGNSSGGGGGGGGGGGSVGRGGEGGEGGRVMTSQYPTRTSLRSMNGSYNSLDGEGSPVENMPRSPVMVNGGGGGVDGGLPPDSTPTRATSTMVNGRIQRPSGPARIPSSTYAPSRYPVSVNSSLRTRSHSATRRKDPNAQYHAQEGAYVRRLRQPPAADYFDSSGLFHGSSEMEDESPSSDMYPESDSYGNEEVLLMFGQDDIEPSLEELKIPENRERLEWHAMLSSVLTGDVVKQEKKRIGSVEERGGEIYKNELFVRVKARVCGRSLAAQKRMLEEGRAELDQIIDDIVNFEIQGKDKTELSPREQVKEILDKWDKHEVLYPTGAALRKAKPRAGSPEFLESYVALVSWWNVTNLIDTQLHILEKWVGNSELDFSKRNVDPESGIEISFLDRILKEDGLKSLVGSRTVLMGISTVVSKAKHTFIENSEAFQKRHLPLFIEELLVLINFPTRLIEQVISVRLRYARKMKVPTMVMVTTLIEQLHIVLGMGIRVKQEYMAVWQQEPGWQLPPCMDENFEPVVMEALRFYFRLLHWLVTNQQHTSNFEGAELLEKEWKFANGVGKYIDDGDMLVAEQFSSLTSKLLAKLMQYFENELKKRPEKNGSEFTKRFKAVLDAVRVGQRRLFRFARELSQRFENATEYNIDRGQVDALIASLIASGHFLLVTPSLNEDNIVMIADPTLYDKPDEVTAIVRASIQEDNQDLNGFTPHYVLILYYEDQIAWDGKAMMIDARTPPNLEIKAGTVRLVARGSQDRLAAAREAFQQSTGHNLDITVEQRANLSSVNHELFKIKRTTYRLSNSIMDSVETIRQQTKDLGCQELIHTCFAFATEFGQRSVMFMDTNRRAVNNLKLAKLAIDWVSFIVDDCIASNRQTFKWAVTALEFAMVMTRGQYILSINGADYARLRLKVAGCMSLLISHFDIMGARSNIAAQAEKQMNEASMPLNKLDFGSQDEEELKRRYSEALVKKLDQLDSWRKDLEMERRLTGRVLDDKSGMDQSLTILTSSFSNVTLRWQQGQFLGSGSSGDVYAAVNLDTGGIMAVKEIRLQDPQLTTQVATAIRDEMRVLEVLDHPNVVSYLGIEVHRDKVYLFMEYCGGGSLASLLEHGRIEDETVLMIYTFQMLEGLAYLHASNVVHRDIKPENILLDSNGVIKYVDFGAAKVIAKSGKTRAFAKTKSIREARGNSMTGTPMYMSPEAITGTTRDNYSAMDVWSLGCVILEAATGRKPWVNLDNEWAIMWNIAGGQKPQLPTPDQLSPAGIDFLSRCFERDASKRATAAELLQHEWISAIKNKVIEPGTPSDTSSNSGK